MDVDLNLKSILADAGITPQAGIAEAGAAPAGGPGAPTLQNQNQAVSGALPQAAAQIASTV
jgi:hypothetical protein